MKPAKHSPQSLDEALAAVQASDVVALVRDLVDIPSPTGDELECAKFLDGYCQRHGVPSRLHTIEGRRANVVASIPGTGGGPTLMLNGHLDTTFYGDEADWAIGGEPAANDRPESFEVDGGVYGLGAYNMKGGVAAIFAAMNALSSVGVRLPGTIMASGVAGESEKAPVQGTLGGYFGPRYNGSGYGTQHLIRHVQPLDYAIVAEPSDLYVVNAQAGFLFIKVVLKGPRRSLKTGSQRTTSDAVRAMASVVEELDRWAVEYSERHRYDTGNGVLTPFLNVGSVECGWPFFPSQRPGLCHVYINQRLTPALPAGQAVRELDEVIGGIVAQHPGVEHRLEVFGNNSPSTMTPANDLLPRTAVQVMEQRMGFATTPFAPGQADPSNDSNVFRRRGVPTIKCGPTTRTEGNAEEATQKHGRHVYRDDLVAAARFYIHMFFELCGKRFAELGD